LPALLSRNIRVYLSRMLRAGIQSSVGPLSTAESPTTSLRLLISRAQVHRCTPLSFWLRISPCNMTRLPAKPVHRLGVPHGGLHVGGIAQADRQAALPWPDLLENHGCILHKARRRGQGACARRPNTPWLVGCLPSTPPVSSRHPLQPGLLSALLSGT
jgi:hypothetical protein